jgi:hypothetical protein
MRRKMGEKPKLPKKLKLENEKKLHPENVVACSFRRSVLPTK